MVTMKEIAADVKTMKIQNVVKKDPMVLFENNLTKAKRALMVPKIPCPNHTVCTRVRSRGSTRRMDRATILKLRETLVKKEQRVP